MKVRRLSKYSFASRPTPLEQLSEVIDRLDGLDPTDPVWDLLHERAPDLYVRAAKTLELRGLLVARRRSAQDGLLRDLTRFKSSHGSELDYHEVRETFETVESLSQQAVFTEDDVCSASDLLKEFEAMFKEHSRLLSEKPSTRGERQRIQGEIGEAENRISRLARDLLALVEKLSREGPSARKEQVLLKGEGPADSSKGELDPDTGDPSPGDSHDAKDEASETKAQVPAVQKEEQAQDPEEDREPFPAQEVLEDEMGQQPDFSRQLLPSEGQQVTEPPVVPEVVPPFPLDPLVWGQFSRGKFAEAYWLSLGAGDEKGLGPVTDALLACAMQACRGSEPPDHTSDFSFQLAQIFGRRHHPVEDLLNRGLTREEACMLTCAASVTASLLDPVTGALNWLQQAAGESFPGNGTLKVISEFLTKTRWTGLTPTLESGGASPGEEIARIREEARDWVGAAGITRFELLTATQVLRHLGDPKEGVVGSVMEAISRGDDPRSSIPSLPSSSSEFDALIKKAMRSLGRAPVDIVGIYRNRLHRLLKQAWAIQVRYLEAHKEFRDLRQNVDATPQIAFKEFVNELGQCFAQERDVYVSGSPRRQALAKGLTLILERVIGIFSGEGGDIPGTPWVSYLQAPLLSLERIPVSEEEPLPEKLTLEQAQELSRNIANPRPTEDLVRAQADRLDFYAANLILDSTGDPVLRNKLTPLLEEKAKRAQDVLDETLTALRNAIEEATLDNTLSESEKSDFDGIALSLAESKDERLYLLLDEAKSWLEELRQRRRKRADSLTQHLGGLQAKIAGGEENLVTAAAAGYVERALEALGKGDTVLADEYTGRAEDILRSGTVETHEEQVIRTDDYEVYKGVWHRIQDSLEAPGGPERLRGILSEGRSAAGIDMREVPGARYPEIRSGLRAFAGLKRGPSQGAQKKIGQYVQQVMEYLGFVGTGAAELQDREDDYQHFRVQVAMHQQSPIPQFGSALKGLSDVLVVWRRPDVASMASLVDSLRLQNPVILYMGRLTKKQLADWSVITRARAMTALLVDEILIHFLAGQRSNRLRAAVSCSMPRGYANPFSFSGSTVPPEVFCGREEELKQLERALGSAVIYGGRQLGKSAMLREFHRRYHNPEMGHYVVFKDIKNTGKPGPAERPDAVWAQIGQGLREAGFPIKERAGEEEVVFSVKARMREVPSSRVWVLLDEADDFLKADGEDPQTPFAVVHKLKELMDLTDRHFKVVFSGLHSVQRYTSVPNHPFAHFETPMVIGPLKPRDALKLIMEPLHALGFRFPKIDAAYRILAYTNSHPALVQLFCSEIAKMSVTASPPYEVTVDMVEQVFRNQDTRRIIRERFEWTLDLDDRYAGLVYAIVDAQKDIPDGFRKEFSVEESMDIARAAWPSAFTQVGPEECRSLLDELVGLGIMIRASGGYRLRNANVVTTLGSKAEIEEKLRLLAQREVPPKDASMDRRIKLSDGGGWHPLTLAQEATLRLSHQPVSLIFGSQALGQAQLRESIRETFVRVCDVPGDLKTVPRLLSWLKMQSTVSKSLTVALLEAGRLFRFPLPFSECVEEIAGVLKEGDHSLHLFVCFGPSDVASWHGLCQREREKVLGYAGYPVVCRKWERHFLQMMLKDENFLGGALVADEVYELTSGWPLIAHTLFGSGRKGSDHVDPRPPALRLLDSLVNDRDQARAFLKHTGLSQVPYGVDVVRFVMSMNSILPCDVELMPTPFIGVGERITALNALVDLAILHEEGPKRELVVDPLVRTLLTHLK